MGFVAPLLKCITLEKGLYVLQEIHEGVYSNHSRLRSLINMNIQKGYYWPSMLKDIHEYVQACDTCQSFSQITNPPADMLTLVLIPWPFSK